MGVFGCTFKKSNVFSRGCTKFEYSRLFTIFIFCTPPPDFIGVFECQIVLQFWGLKVADFTGGIELDKNGYLYNKPPYKTLYSHDVSIKDWNQVVKRKLNIGGIIGWWSGIIKVKIKQLIIGFLYNYVNYLSYFIFILIRVGM